MNKTIVGIVALWLWTLAINAFQDESPKSKSIPTVVTEQKTTTPTKSRYQETKPSVPILENTVPVIYKPIENKEASNSNCDQNYSGCVPIASDVDCAGWKWNWPAYVRWPIQVIWSDIYDLDRDNDWWGCE